MKYRNLITLLFLLFASVSSILAKDTPRAKDGLLDLREYDFFENGVLRIEGEWHFHWNQIIDPSLHIDSSQYIVEVPSSWNKLKGIVPGIEPKGFASYHLKIIVPNNIERVAFRFNEVFSGSGYYINGKNIGFNGFPGANPYQNLFDTRASLHTASLSDSVINLVVHVSNFHFRSGGMKGIVELGLPMQVMEERARRQHRDFFLIGGFLIVGIFFMGMYLIHTELYKLFFSLICLLFAFRLALLSESGYLGWVSGITHIRLEYISFSLMVPLFIMMIRHIFPNDFPQLPFRFILWICILMIIVLILSPISLFSPALVYYFIFVGLTGLVLLAVMYKAIARGRTYAIGYAIGILVVLLGVMNDILIVSDILETSYKGRYAMFAYVLIYALIFSLKSNIMLRRSEQLTFEISEVNENLEAIVEERTRELSLKSEELLGHKKELQERNLELQQLITIRNRFFTIIGHDIRGPVGYTAQMIDMLLQDEVKEEEKDEILNLLMNSSKATMELLENLMVWGRSQIGNLTAKPVVFALKPVIQETCDLFSHAIMEKKISLDVSVKATRKVNADREQIKMLIRNLLSNAIKFTGNKGEIRIRADISEYKKEAILTISDSGIGIPALMQEKLFSSEEFYTTDGTSNEKGTGLGLKLCKEIIELNKGWISVESRTGVGTVFTVGIPL
jgi:signal transduction histidine kinase